MAKVFIEETTLTAIGDAIRGKEGTTELVPVNDMATRITSLPEGGGGNEPTDEELTLTGDCQYRFYGGAWDWIIEKYGDRITTKEMTQTNKMFQGCNVEEIPFQINITDLKDLSYGFYQCSTLTTCPKIRGTITWSTSTNLAYIIDSCFNLRDIEDLFTDDMLDGFSTQKITSQYSVPKPLHFTRCHSLREIPSWFYKFKLNEESTAYPATLSSLYNSLFQYCSNLNEITDIPVWKCQAAQTSNMFNYAFDNCLRAKNITFETNEDGTAIETQWKSQTIDLSKSVGYAQNEIHILGYNSGITADKRVTDDTTYQALKDDPDWYAFESSMTQGVEYSRYNHDSAVATINSLPDTSAYLATAGGTNTIKFNGGSGELTDGGAINTMTDEEKDVAALKGWTVQIV